MYRQNGVNKVTEKLFKKYKIPEELAQADLKELEQDIHSTGFYKNKAKNIRACCQSLVNEYEGQVIPDIEKLKNLAGVGRKTANVVIGECFGFAEGIGCRHPCETFILSFGIDSI